jgi:hypothetical protein
LYTYNSWGNKQVLAEFHLLTEAKMRDVIFYRYTYCMYFVI